MVLSGISVRCDKLLWAYFPCHKADGRDRRAPHAERAIAEAQIVRASASHSLLLWEISEVSLRGGTGFPAVTIPSLIFCIVHVQTRGLTFRSLELRP